jgi:diaminohydroxyphosphoribosylaminopyrimidine deaminase/5-amino-6-(5-phosphoribosylamino)uracil reductase
MLNAAFFKAGASGLPLVTAKWAMSADGKIATHTGSSQWISGEASRHSVHELRGRVDAVIVGGGTAQTDDPLLTCRDAERRRVAARVVMCGRRLPDLSSRLLQTVEEAPVLICYPEDKPNAELEKLEGLGCELLPLPAAENSRTGVRPEPVLRQLAEREASRVLVEGGSEVLGAFFDEDLVDRAVIFCAPRVRGGAGAVTAVGGTGAGQVEEASMLRGDVFWGRQTSELPAEPRVEVDISGRDVRISGWLSNPLNWGPESHNDQTGYDEERE